MLHSETKRKIDNARDILVGKIPVPMSQIEQITLAMTYKFMSDIDEENKLLGGKTFFEGDFEKYAWKNLMDKRLGAQERMNLYSEGLDSMPKNANIPELFRDIFRNAYLPFKDPQTLDRFLKQINEFSYDHSEELGNAFEYLLSTAGSQGDAGQFRTPRHIIDFLVAIVEPTKDDTILDPACGTAGFLISAYKHILNQNTSKNPGDKLLREEKEKLSKNIAGYDISHDMVRLSLVNLYLHGFADPKISEYDTLSSDDKWNEDFNCILANPPFMTPKGGIEPHSRFSIKASKSEVLFVDYIMEHLTLNGKAGIIVPEGIIFQSANAYKELRKKMIESNFLYAVVSLPSGVFQPYSGVKTSILLFDKQIAKKTDKILFVKVENDGFDLGAQRRQNGYEYKSEEVNIAIKNLVGEIDNIKGVKDANQKVTYNYLGKDWDFQTFKKNDLPISQYILHVFKNMINLGTLDENFEKFLEIGKYTKQALIVEKSKIKESGDYNLSGERYKENTSLKNSDFEMVELGDVLDYEQPTNYIVESENYSDEYKIPVLTAGKSFILGYTNEENGIFPKEKLPVIIFDDFTTANKFVNFPFKVKSSAMKILHPVLNKANPVYLYYVMQKIDFPFTDHKRYWISQYSKIKIPLPPLEIQEQIVAELDNYQKIIDGAKQIVENYKPRIKIDESWEVVELGEVSKVLGGYAFSSKDFKNQGLQVIKMANVKDGFFDKNNVPSFVDEEIKSKANKYLLKKGDIVVSMTGTVGKTDYGNICMIDDGEYLLNQRVGKFEILDSNKLFYKFLYYLGLQENFKTQLFSFSAGGVRQSNISNKGLESIKIPLPPLEIQEQIVARIEEEQKMVESAKGLIEIFENKIKERIGEVWGEKSLDGNL